ncbi:MAG: heavy metal translocating P-type ATPase metal-binding domain-containing protein, partial [Bacteroidota bacterium]
MAEKHAASTCYHCGTSCPEDHPVQDNKSFCCEGCLTVYQLLSDHELCQYYDLEAHPGIRL